MSDDDWVRRLLAEAGRSPEPMPPEVSDRLDRALREAVDAAATAPTPEKPSAQPPTEPQTVPQVVAMTPRRHRRWAGALLAAAALTVGGYSLTATGLLDGLGGSASESSTAADSAGGEAAASDAAPGAAREDAGEAPGALADSPPGGASADEVPTLSSATLRRDATALVAAAGDPTAAAQPDGLGTAASEPATARDGGTCVAPPAAVRGSRTTVTFDGAAATAVVRPLSATRAAVQVWSCEAPTRLARVVVPR